jgi:hypothetical protein
MVSTLIQKLSPARLWGVGSSARITLLILPVTEKVVPFPKDFHANYPLKVKIIIPNFTLT